MIVQQLLTSLPNRCGVKPREAEGANSRWFIAAQSSWMWLSGSPQMRARTVMSEPKVRRRFSDRSVQLGSCARALASVGTGASAGPAREDEGASESTTSMEFSPDGRKRQGAEMQPVIAYSFWQKGWVVL